MSYDIEQDCQITQSKRSLMNSMGPGAGITLLVPEMGIKFGDLTTCPANVSSISHETCLLCIPFLFAMDSIHLCQIQICMYVCNYSFNKLADVGYSINYH
jgi:hypothetical protein